MTQRRDFLKQASLIAAGTVAAGALVAPGATAQAAPVAPGASPAPQPAAPWDMSWAAKVTGKHRMCFDAPEIAEAVCLHQARVFLSGYAAVYGLTDADLSAVIVIRHHAVPMVMGDDLWADGAFAAEASLKDPATGEPALRNPFVRIAAGSQHALTWPDGALDTLISRGVTDLACDLALRNFAGQVATRRKIPRQDALEMIYASLVPGVIRMPSGVFATSHAQSLGCGVLHAG
jgi:hypothetical protein